jgi:ABC-type glycerol-3-phosphate transport system substrate-binding protein
MVGVAIWYCMADTDIDRRCFFKYVAAATAGTTLAGCLGGSSSEQSKKSGKDPWVHDQPQVDNPSKIVWLNLGSMAGDPAAKQHAKRWSEKTGIKANPRIVPPADMLSKSRTLLQAKNPRPDIYQLADTWWWDLGAKGYLEEVSEYVTTFDSWIPGAKKACTLPLKDIPAYKDFSYPEGIYATPWFSEGWITFTNMEVLEKAGLNRNFSPSSFSEFRDACKQLKDIVEYPVLFPFSTVPEGLQILQDLVLRADGHFYKDGKPDFQNQGFVTALDFLLNLVYDGYAPQGVTSLSEGTTTTQFFSGKAGFQFNALGNLFLPGKKLPIGEQQQPSDIARITLYPTPKKKQYKKNPTGNLVAIGSNLSVFSKRKKPSAKYMNYISTKEAQAAELLLEGNLPLRADVFDMKKVQKQVPYTDTMRTQLANYDKLIYPHASRIEEIIFQETTGALAHHRSAKKTAQRIQNQAKSL